MLHNSKREGFGLKNRVRELRTAAGMTQQQLAELVHERFGCKSVINFVGPTIGAHSGQGTLALFYIGTER